MAQIFERPLISGGRTLAKMRSGGKTSSAPKKHSRRQMWGQGIDLKDKSPVDQTRRTERSGIAGKNLRARQLVCGHTVLMLKCQRPSPETWCVQCERKAKG
jgi:hypothetical protein